ncbi:hypothetical protein DEO72_LG11g1690 [Vigna unguiculata]|uniref:Uncharacterized protein n=1 Tax=Vigna unguiculata TaxID=3917 RepID=A0A4D6NM15_VIGUN|nr:hypothetical protein DEO72_LG11g1690 [Vigna unguiculata]
MNHHDAQATTSSTMTGADANHRRSNNMQTTTTQPLRQPETKNDDAKMEKIT